MRDESPKYILELPVKVSQATEHVLCDRFEVARRLYNAVLGEALRRLDR